MPSRRYQLEPVRAAPRGYGARASRSRPSDSAAQRDDALLTQDVETDPLGRPLYTEEPRPVTAEDAAADEELKLAQARERGERRADADVLRHIMRNRNGRDWLYRLLESCHIFGMVADLGTERRASDPFVTYYRDGERNIGNRILQDAQRASGDLFQTMIKEQLEAETARENSET